MLDFIEIDNKETIYKEIVKIEHSIVRCIGCGKCAATCIASANGGFNLRRSIYLLRRGETSEVKSNLSKCMLCTKCFIVCPAGVNTRGVILAMNSKL